MFTIKIEDGLVKSVVFIYFACLSVCLYLINFKTAEMFGPNFCVSTHMTHGRFKDVKS